MATVKLSVVCDCRPDCQHGLELLMTDTDLLVGCESVIGTLESVVENLHHEHAEKLAADFLKDTFGGRPMMFPHPLAGYPGVPPFPPGMAPPGPYPFPGMPPVPPVHPMQTPYAPPYDPGRPQAPSNDDLDSDVKLVETPEDKAPGDDNEAT